MREWDNHAGMGGVGGAIENALGALRVENSTFSANDTVLGHGGAIDSASRGTLAITNSTFSANRCIGGGSGAPSDPMPQGGAIYVTSISGFELCNEHLVLSVVCGGHAFVHSVQEFRLGGSKARRRAAARILIFFRELTVQNRVSKLVLGGALLLRALFEQLAGDG